MTAIEYYINTRQQLFDLAGINPESKFVDLKSKFNNIHYLEIGAGEPMVIIHGAGAHSSHWYNILGPLSKSHHLYVVDCPGNGLSDYFDYRRSDFQQLTSDFLFSFLEATGIKKAIFLGNSLGGYYSINFAIRYPERVNKLILIGAPGGITHYIPFAIRLLGIPGLNHFLADTIKPGLNTMRLVFKQYLVASYKVLIKELLKHESAHLHLPGNMKTFLSLCEKLLRFKGFNPELYIGDKLDQLEMPVNFIWGDKDAFLKPDVGIQKAKTIKDYKFDVVKDAGHLPWLDKPKECIDLIEK